MFSLFVALSLSRVYRHRHHHVESNGRGDDIVRVARTKLGCTYVYGASGPNTFDCSGLTSWVHNQVGISIPRTASSQFSSGRSVSRGDLLPGDLVFFDTAGSGGISHVGIYVGGNSFLHAPRTGDVVKEIGFSSYWNGVYKGARRFW